MLSKKQERLSALERQMSRLKRRLDSLNRRSDSYSWIRLGIFFGGIALSVLMYFLTSWPFALAALLLTLIIFSIVATYHRRVDRSITRHKIWLHIQATQAARITLNWQNIPAVEPGQWHSDHPFESDLDISGEHSLHQLLNTATSQGGRQRLRAWLLQKTPDLETIRQRQILVRELTPLSRFRNKLLLKARLTAKSVAEQWEGKKLLGWLEKHASVTSLRTSLLVSTVFAVLTAVLFVLNLLIVMPQLWIFSLLLSLIWFFLRAGERQPLFEDAALIRDAFAQLSIVFEYLETYPYERQGQLKKLCEPFFREQKHRPSRLVSQLSRLTDASMLKSNALAWLLVNALIPWDTYIAYQLNQHKIQIATRLSVWLDTWFELEALCSLANFAYLNPEYILPQVEESATAEQGQAVVEEQAPLVSPEAGLSQGNYHFQARGLGHPLIEESKKVVNDFALNALGEIVIVTGSNMSGKSTFLRTVGINLCLAYAGGPVNASALQTSLFRIYTCIKVSDSVTDGYSYFYAEVKRLKALLVELEQESNFPLLFLIDEIFKGTNNRERLIGSRAYIQALVGRQCLGLISTHDLELVKLADSLPEIANYHFKEEVRDGQMIFEYLLRSGPCPTTNALKIMQMEGLPIEAFS